MTDNSASGYFQLCQQWFADSQAREFPAKFYALGREFILHKGVFPPAPICNSSAIVPLLPLSSGQTMLDMGAGTGIVGISACLEHDLARVCCADISRPAVKNALANARLHGLGKKVPVVHSDMFYNIGLTQKFDLIFWYSASLDHPHSSDSQELNYMIADPNYAAHKKYVQGGFSRLNPGGRLMLAVEHRFPLGYMNQRLNKFGAHAEVFDETANSFGDKLRLLNVVRVRN